MKHLVRYFSLLLCHLLATACSNDYGAESTLPPGTPVMVHFHLSTYDGPATSRAWDGATSGSLIGEKIKSWVVIVVNKSTDVVENVLAKSNLNDAETDEVASNQTAVQTFTGEKRVYTFANIAHTDLESALGVAEGSISNRSLVGQSLTQEGVNLADKGTFLPHGNNWDINSTTGIPMSNWQDINITADNETHWLYVCRMIAKLEFQFTNNTGKDLVIKNLSINDITTNDTPISLLPSLSVNKSMSGTLTPVFPTGSERTTETVRLYPNEGTLNVNNGQKVSQTLYVNESAVAASSRYAHFLLTLAIDRDEGVNEDLRYVLLSNDHGNWNYISRNDHRIIPVNIEDYKFDLIPVDFPPIGVYPAAVKEEDGVFTCTFHAPGDFELIPVITSQSGNATYEFISWTTPSTTLTGESNNANDIYQVIPTWDDTLGRIVGTFNNANKGHAYHEMTVRIKNRELLYRIWIIRE